MVYYRLDYYRLILDYINKIIVDYRLTTWITRNYSKIFQVFMMIPPVDYRLNEQFQQIKPGTIDQDYKLAMVGTEVHYRLINYHLLGY